MIEYEAGSWGICFARRVYGSVFPKAFVIAAPVTLAACIMHWALRYDDSTKQTLDAGQTGTSLLGGFFFILGFLIVFRSQHAYARWWEGSSLLLQMRGEWFNATSCILTFASRSHTRSADVYVLRHQLVRLVSLLHALALAECSTTRDKLFELIDCDGMDSDSLAFLQSKECHDPCEIVLNWIQRRLAIADDDKIIEIAPPMLARVYNQLAVGLMRLDNARRISMCPIPYPLAQMITVMLGFHSCIVPLMCATTVDHPFWCGFLTFIVVISFWSINYIALELEMPFGSDPNDLPLQDLQVDMNLSLKSLMNEKATKCPDFLFSKKVHAELRTVLVDVQKSLLIEARPSQSSLDKAIQLVREQSAHIFYSEEATRDDQRRGGGSALEKICEIDVPDLEHVDSLISDLDTLVAGAVGADGQPHDCRGNVASNRAADHQAPGSGMACSPTRGGAAAAIAPRRARDAGCRRAAADDPSALFAMGGL